MAVGAKVLGVGFALVLAMGACGGDDDDELDAGVDDAPVVETTDGSSDATVASRDETTTSADDGDDDEDDENEDAAIVVDTAALPTEPSGYETLAGDLCAAYEVAELDAYFSGEGELAIEEKLQRGCRWAVEGLPRTHFVSLTVQPAADPDIYETREEDVAGTTVLLSSSANTDSRAWISAPDGSGDLLSVTVHGEYGAPDGPLPDEYLDPAVIGLVENLLARL